MTITKTIDHKENIKLHLPGSVSNFLFLVGQAYSNLYHSVFLTLRGKVNLSDTIFQASTRGVDSIVIILITCIFIGMALALQLTNELIETYGAETAVGGLIALAIIRELAPVVTAIVMAGRVGASITAEIGTMKATEQIDALKVIDIDLVEYLIVPRILAVALITPMMTIVAAIAAVLAAMYLSNSYKGLEFGVFLESVKEMLTMKDLFVALLKASCFGTLIVTIACTFGLNVIGGANEVGNYSTRTVVWSLIIIFTVNYLITSMFYGV